MFLFDPDAIPDLLAEDESPGRAFRRFPRRRRRAIRRSLILPVGGNHRPRVLLIDEPLPEHAGIPEEATVTAALVLPSGRIQSAGERVTPEPATEVTRVRPGRYDVRMVVANRPSDAGLADVDDGIDPRADPSSEERKALRRHRRVNAVLAGALGLLLFAAEGFVLLLPWWAILLTVAAVPCLAWLWFRYFPGDPVVRRAQKKNDLEKGRRAERKAAWKRWRKEVRALPEEYYLLSWRDAESEE